MSRYKFFRLTHRWLGIFFAVVLLNISVTGLLLLEKKQFEWIQPPTHVGAQGQMQDFISTQQVLEAVLAQGHADFQSVDDIDRIDFRPGKRVHKVKSEHNHTEMQIDAITGKVLHTAVRRSDVLEALHDGSFFGDWVHDIFMPTTAVVCILLTLGGLYLWLAPKFNKRNRKVENR